VKIKIFTFHKKLKFFAVSQAPLVKCRGYNVKIKIFTFYKKLKFFAVFTSSACEMQGV